MGATSTFSLAFNPKTSRVTTQPTFPCWIQINLYCFCAQTTSCMQTCSLLTGAGDQKKKTLPASDLQPHPTPPTPTAYTAWCSYRGWGEVVERLRLMCVCVGRGGDVRFLSRGKTCVLVWESWGIKWRRRRGDEETCWEGSLYTLLLLPAIPLPPSLASFHPPPPLSPSMGVKYITCLLIKPPLQVWRERSKRLEFSSFFLFLLTSVCLLHLPPAPPSSPKLSSLLSSA